VAKEITIVGLGPGDPAYITRQGWEVLTTAHEVFIRTSNHPTITGLPLGLVVHSFDHLYQDANSFSEVYDGIVDKLFEELQSRDRLVYAVPGDPGVGEATVAAIRERACEGGIKVQLIPGVSFIEPCLSLLGLDALDGLCVVDALNLTDAHHPPFQPDHPVLVGQLYSNLVASDVKLTLMNQYPDNHEVKLIHQAGTDQAVIESMNLFELDRSEKIGSMTALFISPLPERSSMECFQETVAHLRAPDGCPWDREQTHESLRMHVLEECYEVLHALDAGDIDALEEELGDLLLQIVLQAQIATEAGEFTMADIIRGINTKIIQRHPHVFGELDVSQVDQVLHNWEMLKAAEREAEGNDKGLLDGVPSGLPALAQAYELQSRVARVGFDWKKVEDVTEKIQEELKEVRSAQDASATSAEVGDLLFAVVNYARWLEVDPESTLRSANKRFRNRFRELEQQAKASHQDLSEMTLEEMDTLWEAVKGNEENQG
jgi:tetrapyrrole methylase family protein/MazG family protein